VAGVLPKRTRKWLKLNHLSFGVAGILPNPAAGAGLVAVERPRLIAHNVVEKPNPIGDVAAEVAKLKM
jgi:hypothetical protein